jgi:hypothetical protein
MDAGIQRVEDRADLGIGQLGGGALTLPSSLSWQLC